MLKKMDDVIKIKWKETNKDKFFSIDELAKENK